MADDAQQAQTNVSDEAEEEVTLKRGQIPTATTEMPAAPASAQPPLVLAGTEPVVPSTYNSDTVTVAPNGQASANTIATPASQYPSAHYVDSTPTIPVAPGPRRRPRARNPYSKRHVLLTIMTCLVLVVTVLGLLRYLQLSQAADQTTARQTTGGASIPGLPNLPTPTARSASSGMKGLAVTPKSFDPGNCVIDNGYRCTVTLTLNQNSNGLTWQGSSQGITTKFSPPGGTIAPDQQQQVIIYVYSACPVQGRLIFASKGQTLRLPWRC